MNFLTISWFIESLATDEKYLSIASDILTHTEFNVNEDSCQVKIDKTELQRIFNPYGFLPNDNPDLYIHIVVNRYVDGKLFSFNQYDSVPLDRFLNFINK